jgi:hypothetical protein
MNGKECPCMSSRIRYGESPHLSAREGGEKSPTTVWGDVFRRARTCAQTVPNFTWQDDSERDRRQRPIPQGAVKPMRGLGMAVEGLKIRRCLLTVGVQQCGPEGRAKSVLSVSLPMVSTADWMSAALCFKHCLRWVERCPCLSPAQAAAI